MKASAVYEGVAIAVASSVTTALIAKSYSRLASVQLAPDTIALSALMALLAATVVIFVRRSDQSIKLRLDLLFRMGYLGPFVHEIRQDADERALYSASILRKLHDLAELNRAYRDDRLCSYYIGYLAFLANEKRANLPWKTFRDEVAKNFGDKIIAGKIARHVIDDHYKGMWTDLVDAAGRASQNPKPRLAPSRIGKIIPQNRFH
jgi:hypothetical protein